MSLRCEVEGCSWSGSIRTKVKNTDSIYYGRKVCPAHGAEFNGTGLKATDGSLKKSMWNNTKSKLKSLKPIKKLTQKTKERYKEESDIRSKYFKYHIERCQRSEESGLPIIEPTRANICHIFPKRRYKSVQAEFDNCVYLTFTEHQRFDQLLDKVDFATLEDEFECWDLVVARVEKIMHKVKEDGKLILAFREYILNDKFIRKW
jgi:hypothetical protein